MAAKGDLSVNLCERYVFGGSFQCGPMQYYERCTPVSNPMYVHVSSSIIYDMLFNQTCIISYAKLGSEFSF